MRLLEILTSAALLAPLSSATPPNVQHVMGKHNPTPRPLGVGHFSEWSRDTKRKFLTDWQEGRMSEWTIVMGNEGGDLDSMTAALTWAYHLQHSTCAHEAPCNGTDAIKAIALLQTPNDALDLRPENKVALANSLMTPGHSDLLTLDELPQDPNTLADDVKGIVLVDHAVPLRKWDGAKILSIFDHHVDRGAGPDAEPRVFEGVASCTTLVARQLLDELEGLDKEYHLPHELLELILSAIAIDSGGLKSAKETDRKVAGRVLARSNWRDKDLDDKMQALDDQLKTAKKDLDGLDVRDLLRRDWKGDLVDTPSPRTPTVSLGFSSIPYSLDEQIAKTEFGEIFDWFAIEAAWTAQVGADINVALNSYKVAGEEEGAEVEGKHGKKHGKKGKKGDKKKKLKKQKIREIVLVVRKDLRIGEEQADSLFETVSKAIEADKSLNVKPWHRAKELGRRQMVWTHENEDAGRKVVRPIIEDAVKAWDM